MESAIQGKTSLNLRAGAIAVAITFALYAFVFCDSCSAMDKQEVSAHVFSFAATIGDLETTRAALGNSRCHELDPLYGRDPGRARLYGTAIPIAAAASIAAHILKKRGSHHWALAPLANGTIHAGGLLVNNFSGCYY